mgnify:CR=1 FL=1
MTVCVCCNVRLRLSHPNFAPANENWKSEENIEEALVNKELQDLILRFTGDLPPKQKLVFTLRDIEELDVAEVISITG